MEWRRKESRHQQPWCWPSSGDSIMCFSRNQATRHHEVNQTVLSSRSCCLANTASSRLATSIQEITQANTYDIWCNNHDIIKSRRRHFDVIITASVILEEFRVLDHHEQRLTYLLWYMLVSFCHFINIPVESHGRVPVIFWQLENAQPLSETLTLILWP